MKIEKLAAIDIGSNGMRLLINYVYEKEGEAPVFNKTSLVRMPIRLGEDVFIKNKISKKTEQRMLQAMKSYKLTMDVYGVEKYLAYGTSALRESENGLKIIDKIKKEAKINIEIIDGNTESRLVFDSELKQFVMDKYHYLYVDVGGGSTELTLLKNKKIGISRSFKVGTVRLLKGKTNPGIFDEMKDWIGENIIKHEVDLIGAGGNINHVYSYSDVKKGKPLNGHYLRKYFKEIKSLSYDERLRKFNMKTDRADVIEHALEIYTKVFKWTGAKKIYVPKIGIADGMIRMLYEELHGERLQ